jgi:hypothetical protein
MKIAASLAFALGILICHSSRAQSTDAATKISKEASPVRFSDVKINYGFGSVLMSEQPKLYTVQLPVGGGSSFEKHPYPDVSGWGLQVWLLKADGTAVPQQGKPSLVRIGNAGSDMDYMVFAFAEKPGSTDELAGVTVRVKGKFYCHEITADGK